MDNVKLVLVCGMLVGGLHAAESQKVFEVVVENDIPFTQIYWIMEEVVERPDRKKLLHAPVIRAAEPGVLGTAATCPEDAPLLLEWLTQKSALNMSASEGAFRERYIDFLLAIGADPNRWRHKSPLEHIVNFGNAKIRRNVIRNLLKAGASVSDPNLGKGVFSIILGRLKNCVNMIEINRHALINSDLSHPRMTQEFISQGAYSEIRAWLEDIPMLVEYGADPYEGGDESIYEFVKSRDVPFALKGIEKARKKWREKITMELLKGWHRTVSEKDPWYIYKNAESNLTLLPIELLRLIHQFVFEGDIKKVSTN